MSDLLFALWFFWPAGVAILVPVLAAHTPLLRRWNQPMDGGYTWRGKRIFGDNKTWRGIITGTVAGTLWCYIQTRMYVHADLASYLNQVNYGSLSAVWIGFTVSLGALLGDAFGSFLKRQRNIAPGAVWFPYDQLDFIVGGLLLSLLAVRLPIAMYLLIAIIWLTIHMVFNALGYIAKMQDSPI